MPSQVCLKTANCLYSSLRTSETNYLNESYAFYSAIRMRGYYSKANKEDRCVTVSFYFTHIELSLSVTDEWKMMLNPLNNSSDSL